MAFPRKLLNEGEDVILDLRPHFWFFAGPAAAVVIAIVAAVLLSGLADVLAVAGAALVVVTLLWFLTRYAKWTTTNFVVTTDRLIHRQGVLAKSGREIPLDRVNDITFNQSIFERIIRAGDLVIESGGERGQQSFSNIPKPSLVQNEIYRQIEASQARDADRMAGRRELSIPEQIDRLDDLRQRGVITQAEFDAKKSQLLDRM